MKHIRSRIINWLKALDAHNIRRYNARHPWPTTSGAVTTKRSKP